LTDQLGTVRDRYARLLLALQDAGKDERLTAAGGEYGHEHARALRPCVLYVLI
jgi:hypothetical protein